MKIFLYLYSVGFLFFSCQNGPVPLVDPPGGKSFWAVSINPSTLDPAITDLTPYVVPALFVGASQHLEVYQEIYSKNKVSAATIENLILKFENSIIPIEHRIFGKPLDVDGNGKLTILLLDIQDGYSGSEFISGYFDPWNQFADSLVYDKTSSKSRSNEKEMLYLDTYPSNLESNSFLATAAHEYQHLLHFSHDLLNKTGTLEEKWVNEGLSEVASDLAGFGPQSLRLVGFSGTSDNSLVDWSDQLADYSNVYSYFRYLADAFSCTASSCDILSAIFASDKVGIEGVNVGIDAYDVSFAAACGNVTGLANPSFQCSFRYFWANILSLSNVNGNFSSSSFFFIPDTMYDIASNHLPTLPSFSSVSIAQFIPFGYGLFKKNSGDIPTLNAGVCPGVCDVANFSILYETSATNYLIYNHSESVTGFISRTPQLNVVAQATTTTTGAYKPNYKEKRIHISIPQTILSGLK